MPWFFADDREVSAALAASPLTQPAACKTVLGRAEAPYLEYSPLGKVHHIEKHLKGYLDIALCLSLPHAWLVPFPWDVDRIPAIAFFGELLSHMPQSEPDRVFIHVWEATFNVLYHCSQLTF